MNCNSCREVAARLIKVHITDMSDPNQFVSTTPRVCPKCLVGATVPVYRQQANRWEFGHVESFHFQPDQSDYHCLYFSGGKREYAHVADDPYASYIAHIHIDIARKKHIPFLDQNHNQQHHNNVSPATSQGTNNEEATADDNDSNQMSMEESTTFLLNVASNSEPRLPSPPNRVFRTSSVNRNNANHSYTAEMQGFYRGPKMAPIYCENGIRKKDEKSPSRPMVLTSKSGRKKSPIRMWTAEEDKLLRQTIETSASPWKWPEIAKSIPGRNGKQCRERFLNHLNPSLKFDRWTIAEDAALFHFFHSCGSKWSSISKLLPGRTDNSIKNRFHHLIRKIEKKYLKLPPTKTTTKLDSKLRKSPLFRGELHNMDDLEVKCLIVHVVNAVKSAHGGREKKTGEFRLSKVGGEMCKRCNLMIPSTQTGRFVCKKTGWCRTCKGMSPYLSGDMLRAIHWLQE